MNKTEKVYGRKIIRNGTRKDASLPEVKKAKVYLTALLAGAAVIGLILGILIGFLIWHQKEVTGTADPVVIEDDKVVYGTADGRVFDAEVNWIASDAPEEFVPLDVPMSDDLQEFVYDLCYAYDINWKLVIALIEQESEFEANAVSSTEDYGLMQINKSNHEWLSQTLCVTDFLDAKQNIRAGVFVLRKLFEKYDSTSKVLMAYNMGEGTAQNLWDAGITQSKYSQEVLSNMENLSERRTEE